MSVTPPRHAANTPNLAQSVGQLLPIEQVCHAECQSEMPSQRKLILLAPPLHANMQKHCKTTTINNTNMIEHAIIGSSSGLRINFQYMSLQWLQCRISSSKIFQIPHSFKSSWQRRYSRLPWQLSLVTHDRLEELEGARGTYNVLDLSKLTMYTTVNKY
jgi:hypothetical protein